MAVDGFCAVECAKMIADWDVYLFYVKYFFSIITMFFFFCKFKFKTKRMKN